MNLDTLVKELVREEIRAQNQQSARSLQVLDKYADKLVLSKDEVMEIFDISEDTLAGAVDRGEIPAVRFGRSIRFPLNLIEQVLKGEWKPEVSEKVEGKTKLNNKVLEFAS